MASEIQSVEGISVEQTKNAHENELDYSLETLSFLVHCDHVSTLKEKTEDCLHDVQIGQKRVRFYHEWIKLLNRISSKDGSIDFKNNKEVKQEIADLYSDGCKLKEEAEKRIETIDKQLEEIEENSPKRKELLAQKKCAEQDLSLAKDMVDVCRLLGVDTQKSTNDHVVFSKTSFNRRERDSIIDNLKLTCDDLNTENEMMLQQISQMQNERYQSFQFINLIAKSIDGAKKSIIRNIRG